MTSTNEKIHIVTSVERRRRWSPEEKRSIVQEPYLPGASLSLIASKYGMFPSQLFVWRKHMENGAMKGISSQDELVTKQQLKELEKRLRDTERVLEVINGQDQSEETHIG